jgi:hypothetical protein
MKKIREWLKANKEIQKDVQFQVLERESFSGTITNVIKLINRQKLDLYHVYNLKKDENGKILSYIKISVFYNNLKIVLYKNIFIFNPELDTVGINNINHIDLIEAENSDVEELNNNLFSK